MKNNILKFNETIDSRMYRLYGKFVFLQISEMFLPDRFRCASFSSGKVGNPYRVTMDDIEDALDVEITIIRASANAPKVTQPPAKKRLHEIKKPDAQSSAKDIAQAVTKMLGGKDTPQLHTAGDITPVNSVSTSSTTKPVEVVCLEMEEDEPKESVPISTAIYNIANSIADDDDDDDDDSSSSDSDDDSSSDSEEPQRITASQPAKAVVSTKSINSVVPTGSKNRFISKAVNAYNKTSRANQPRGSVYTRSDLRGLISRTQAQRLEEKDNTFADPTFMLTTPEIPWNHYEVLMIERVYSRVPTIVACVGTIKGLVFGDGIKFVRDNVEMVPSQEFQRYTARYLMAFANCALDAYFMWGMIPFLYAIDPVTKHVYPYVPETGTFVIKKYTVRGKTMNRFYWTSAAAYSSAWRQQRVRTFEGDALVWKARQVDPAQQWTDGSAGGGILDDTVEIIFDIGHNLTSNGSLTSKMASLIDMAMSRMKAQRNRVIAESNLAQPTIFTEYNNAIEKQASQNFQRGFYTGAQGQVTAEGNDIADMIYERDAASREAFAGMLRQFEETPGYDASVQFGVRPDEYRNDVMGGTAVTQPNAKNAAGQPAIHANQYHLSAGRVLANGPNVSTSNDHIAFLQYLDDEACSVFGIPGTYLRGTSIRNAGELIMNRTSDEVTRLKRMLGEILTHIYRVMFLNKDVAEYMSSVYRSKRMQSLGYKNALKYITPLLTEDDLYETTALKSVEVQFAKKPSDSTEDLNQLWAMGAISDKTMCAELARRNNFDPLQLECNNDDIEAVPIRARRMLVPGFADYEKMVSAEKLQELTLSAQAEQQKRDQTMQKMQLKSQEKMATQQMQQKDSEGGGGGASSSSATSSTKKADDTKDTADADKGDQETPTRKGTRKRKAATSEKKKGSK